jgi:hypothetical protein
MSEYKINTEHVYPPIPIRSFDWVATLEGYEGEGGKYQAHGATEEEAKRNLIDQLDNW